ncbi:hypothetical protein C6P46_004130 [Rhodotorula mucilaginosa]|uniref:Uncharacterized protein n=1 Tax=Rhodotorula mucilaginosa TaxID=5537 RepID=A0A9P6W2Z0_RHOMI|nr:hypothetical protein C6P46_004130 [Rhodotorula mucilaginosa]
MCHPSRPSQEARAGQPDEAPLTLAQYENALQQAWTTHPVLRHWRYEFVKATLVKALNHFMHKTYGCGGVPGQAASATAASPRALSPETSPGKCLCTRHARCGPGGQVIQGLAGNLQL